MRKVHIAWCLIALLAIAVYACASRYEMRVSGEYGATRVLDRWTGTVTHP